MSEWTEIEAGKLIVGAADNTDALSAAARKRTEVMRVFILTGVNNF